MEINFILFMQIFLVVQLIFDTDGKVLTAFSYLTILAHVLYIVYFFYRVIKIMRKNYAIKKAELE